METTGAPGAFNVQHQRSRKRKQADPDLARAFCDIIPSDATVLDFGAGTGRYTDALINAGYDAEGIDGTPGIEDLSGGTVGFCDLTGESVPCKDWTICIEVGEHIPELQLGFFLVNLANSARDGLIISWAVPGQRGRNHVSCRWPEWVCQEMFSRFWRTDFVGTGRARLIAGGGWAKKLLVFRPKVLPT